MYVIFIVRVARAHGSARPLRHGREHWLVLVHLRLPSQCAVLRAFVLLPVGAIRFQPAWRLWGAP